MKTTRWTGLGIFVAAVGFLFSSAWAGDALVTLDTTNGSSAFIVRDADSNELARVQSDGKVGIGTTSPSQKLEVDGSILADQFRMDESSYFQLQEITSPSDDVVLGFDNNDYMCYERDNDFLFFNVGGAHRMRITSSGRVGIGTESPEAMLHVVGAVGSTFGARYFNGGTDLTEGTTTFNMSILASSDIVANGSVLATSDKRVKQNIAPLDHPLDMIGQLRPVSYTKIDDVQFGGRLNYGFIAQEVETVLPAAVSTGPGEVPVLKPFDQVEFVEGAAYTILVKKGDEIAEQVYTPGEARPEGEIIVKSQHVDDLKSLSYDMIFSVAVGAIQELKAENDALRARLDALEARVGDQAATGGN